jgi:hypothetical protein
VIDQATAYLGEIVANSIPEGALASLRAVVVEIGWYARHSCSLSLRGSPVG